jgi:hypothetical protein
MNRWLDMGSSESKAKGSFGQKEFDISNMGETALEEEPRGALNIMIFLKINHHVTFKCTFPPILLILVSFIHTNYMMEL